MTIRNICLSYLCWIKAEAWKIQTFSPQTFELPLCLSSIYAFPVFDICHSIIGSAQATAAVSHGLLTLCSEVRIKHNKLPYVTIRDQTALLCGTAVLFHLFQSRHDVLWEWSELSVSWDYCESTSCDQLTAGEGLRVLIIWLSQHIIYRMILGSFFFVYQSLECVWMQSKTLNLRVRVK